MIIDPLPIDLTKVDRQRQAKQNSDNIRCFTYSGNRLKEMYEQNKIRDVPQYWTHFV